MTRLIKYVWIALGLGLGLAVIFLLTAFFLFRNYLASDEFRKLVSYQTSRQIKAHGEFAPFQWTGFSAYTDSFQADGDADSYIDHIEVGQIRAQLDVGAILRGQWLIQVIEIKQLKLSLKKPSAPAPEGNEAVPTLSPLLFFLPREVVLKEIDVENASVTWGKQAFLTGGIRGTNLVVESEDSSWNVSGNGGTLDQAPLSSLNLGAYRLRYAPAMNMLNLVSCELQDTGTGTIEVTGSLNFDPDQKFELNADLKGVDPAFFLTGDWRARIKGKVNGRIMASGSEQDVDSIQSSGDMELLNGEVDGLPGLDKYEAYIPTADYRDFPLNTAKFIFTGTGLHFQVTDIHLESNGLFQISGKLNVDNQNLDGLCDFGTTEKSLSLLPGARQDVFKDMHDGYLWTKVKIFGSVTNPKEDLSGRLTQAVIQSTVNNVTGQVKDKAATIYDATQQLLDSVIK